MLRRTPLLAAASLLFAALTVTVPATAAPQNLCDGPFCATMDLTTFDAAAPTQPTTAAGQPVNLQLRFLDTAPTVASDPARWLAEGIARLGTSSSKTMLVTDPGSLPLGSYVAGTAATAASCAPGIDGSGYATTCPAGSGSGHVQLILITDPTHPTIAPLKFGIQSVTTGVGGAMTAAISIWIPGTSVLPISVTAPIAYNPPTANAGPKLTVELRQTLTPGLLYNPGLASLNDVTLTLNGQVTEAAGGAVSPAQSFIRQPLLCSDLTTTLQTNARGPQTVTAPFAMTVNGCPPAPKVTSIAPVDGQLRAFSFTTAAPVAGVAGRTVSLEWVFGDGAKALTGASTTHTYPVAKPVTALVTAVDSAGARSTSVQVKIAADRLRGKQQEGDLVTGLLADQDTGKGVAGQQVVGYRCATRSTPVGQCTELTTATTSSKGAYRLHIPEVTKKGFVLVVHGGTATTSAGAPARFGTSRYLAVLPQPEVTLQLSKKQVHPGASVRLSGKVTPGKKGKTVRLQGLVKGKWRAVGRATVSQQGRYSMTFVVRAPGQHKLKVRALVPGTAATLAATSKIAKIKIQG